MYKVELMIEVRRHIQIGNYRLSDHVVERLGQRALELSNLIFVLLNGVHEENMTLFDTKRHTWKYAVRGKTLEGVELRSALLHNSAVR